MRIPRLLFALAVAVSLLSMATVIQSKGTADATPTVHYNLSALRGRQIATLMNFLDSYNAGKLDPALALLTDEVDLSDCDFTGEKVVEFRGKDKVKAWLQARFADHDQLDIESLEINDTESVGASTIGVSFVRRISDTLISRGYKAGIAPSLAAKVLFTSNGDRVRVFANGPVGASVNMCRLIQAM